MVALNRTLTTVAETNEGFCIHIMNCREKPSWTRMRAPQCHQGAWLLLVSAPPSLECGFLLCAHRWLLQLQHCTYIPGSLKGEDRRHIPAKSLLLSGKQYFLPKILPSIYLWVHLLARMTLYGYS